MSALGYFLHGPWAWSPVLLGACALVSAAYAVAFRGRVRWRWYAAALAVVLLALASPLGALAAGVLFSAHMTQHLLLLLIAPALLVLSLPERLGTGRRWRFLPAVGWAAGLGSMWVWHVPAFCDAAATSASLHALQAASLLAAGVLFWWPILAPDARQRLAPAGGIAYLFTACLGCTALGILLTLTPVEVCPAFTAPSVASSALLALRESIGPERDRQIGGLLMWVPMCSVYVAAILLELNRWFGAPAEEATTT